MKFGGIDLKEGAFGGLDIINQPATSLPQDLASAIGAIQEKLVGATYDVNWYIGKQLVNGMNYTLLAKQTRATREVSDRIVTVTINIPPAPKTYKDATVVKISSECQLPEDAAAAFDTVTKNLLGVNYRPIAFIGTQVVKGVNYHILCQAKTIYPGAQPYAVKMVINEYKEKATLVEIEKID